VLDKILTAFLEVKSTIIEGEVVLPVPPQFNGKIPNFGGYLRLVSPSSYFSPV